jgi:hypothetical protein
MELGPESSPNSSESSAILAAQGAITLRPATLTDAASIADIYNYEVENTTATMDLVPRSLAEQQEWLAERSGAFAAIVAVLGGQVVGFAAATLFTPSHRMNLFNLVRAHLIPARPLACLQHSYVVLVVCP